MFYNATFEFYFRLIIFLCLSFFFIKTNAKIFYRFRIFQLETFKCCVSY